FDFKAGFILREGATPAQELYGRRMQLKSSLIGFGVAIVMVGLFANHFFEQDLIPPVDKVYATTIESGLSGNVGMLLLLWAIPGAIIQLIGGPKRQMGILLATGLLIINPIAGWAVIVGIIIRSVILKVKGPDAENARCTTAAGFIEGDAVYGGCILGGGGGGWIDDGLQKSDEAFTMGSPELVSINTLQDEDYVACVSLVGAPSAKEAFIDAEQLTETVKQMQKEFNQPIKALMTNENGAFTTINGWLQAAATGLPFLDAPCNGRAHPTGSMGSMNLSEEEDYTSIQTFAGGKGSKKVKGSITASLELASDAVRSVSVQAGGMVGVCRNPIDIAYVKKNAAVGGITQAIELGEVFLSVPEGPERIEAVTSHLKGRVIHSGKVSQFELNEKDGFDVGTVIIDDLELSFWNEYMT